MKVERISEHIWCLRTWLVVPVRVWLVVDGEGATLVDAGIPSMAQGILDFIDESDVGPLQSILLTHGHSDHVGAVQGILARHPVPVYAHPREIPCLEGEVVYPRRKKPEHNLPKGLVQPLPVDGEGDLQKVADLTPYPTPGHSPGHVVYHHEEDGVLLAGDLFTSRWGKLCRPMPWFTGDMAEAVRSGGIVERVKPRRLEITHGGPVFDAAGQWEEYWRKHG